jgi:dihydroneopterin aldolase
MSHGSLLAPDYLGFAGRFVGRDRSARIDPHRSALFANSFRSIPQRSSRDATVAKVDYRLLAARGYSVDPVGADAATDRIFVRDFVVPARIGAYAREHGKSQNVRFNVDVKVRRSGHSVEDMRDVFSYDVITDGIRIIVAQEHIAFLATLAERVADLVLRHPRVVSVTMRVESLTSARAAWASRLCGTDGRRGRRASTLSCRDTAAEYCRVNARRERSDGKLGGASAFCPSSRIGSMPSRIARAVWCWCPAVVLLLTPCARCSPGWASTIALPMRWRARHGSIRLCLAHLGVPLRRAASAAAIRNVLRSGGVPVWSPAQMIRGEKDIPWCWDVSSDSLAAWLAGRLGAKRVVLVKHADVATGPLRAEDLVAGGILDPAFPRFLRASGAEASIAGPAGHSKVAVAIRNGELVGARVDLR